jgi:hypothetical protein
MTSDSTTEARWPLLKERAQYAETRQLPAGRRPARSVWLLTGLAFLCGGLVSAAAFSIGWRHQAQRDTAARTALAKATARAHQLERMVAGLRASLGSARSAAAAARASEQALARAATGVGSEATAARGNAGSISAGAGSVDAAAARITSELKTLDTYLTTTPAAQLDPAYISSQTSFLVRRLTRLQASAGTLGNAVAPFDAALRKLGADAAALQR